MLDFLPSSPTSKQIRTFKASAGISTHLERLLAQSGKGENNPVERIELDAFAMAGYTMIWPKARLTAFLHTQLDGRGIYPGPRPILCPAGALFGGMLRHADERVVKHMGRLALVHPHVLFCSLFYGYGSEIHP